MAINNRRRQGYKAQRSGAIFESEIEAANRYYQMHRKGVIAKIPTGTKMTGKVAGQPVWTPSEKTGCDYLGVYHGTAVAIEAKSTGEGTRFPLYSHGQKPMDKPHQLEFLNHFNESGGRAFVLIHFKKTKTVYRLTIGEYEKLKERAENVGKKSIPIGWFEQTTEVTRTGYVLDYLDGIHR